MGSALFPLFLVICGGDTDLAWRTVFIVPGALAVLTASVVFLNTDDCPKGNYDELKRKDEIVSHLIGTKKDTDTLDSGWESFLNALKDLNTVVLMIQVRHTHYIHSTHFI
jgi:sugar phosphate permease